MSREGWVPVLELTVLTLGLVAVAAAVGEFGRRRRWGTRRWGVAAVAIGVAAAFAVALMWRTLDGAEPPPLRVADDGSWVNYLTVDGSHDEVAEAIDDAGGWVLNHIDDPVDGERTSAVFDVDEPSETRSIAEHLRQQGYDVIYPWPAATTSTD